MRSSLAPSLYTMSNFLRKFVSLILASLNSSNNFGVDLQYQIKLESSNFEDGTECTDVTFLLCDHFMLPVRECIKTKIIWHHCHIFHEYTMKLSSQEHKRI
jgi:hypothetical protein